MSESPATSGDEIADHQVIIRGGQVEAVVVPLEEYRALKALERREAELYWAVHEARYPSRPGDDAPDAKVYDSMDALLADLGSDSLAPSCDYRLVINGPAHGQDGTTARLVQLSVDGLILAASLVLLHEGRKRP